MEIGRILQANQPDVFSNMKRHNQGNRNRKKKSKEDIDFKKLMEQGRVYKKEGRAIKQVR